MAVLAAEALEEAAPVAAVGGNQTLGDGSFLFDNDLAQMRQTKKNRPRVFDVTGLRGARL